MKEYAKTSVIRHGDKRTGSLKTFLDSSIATGNNNVQISVNQLRYGS
jgi:hypothetical protein